MLTALWLQNQPEYCEWEHPSFTWTLKMLCWSPLGSSGFGEWKGDTGSGHRLLAAFSLLSPAVNLFLLQALMFGSVWPHYVLDTLCVGLHYVCRSSHSDPWGSFQGATQFLHSASLLLKQKRKSGSLFTYIIPRTPAWRLQIFVSWKTSANESTLQCHIKDHACEKQLIYIPREIVRNKVRGCSFSDVGAVDSR